MTRRYAFALLISLLATTACSRHTGNETADVANSVAADANVTMQSAVNTVDVATDRALGAGEATINDVGNVAETARNQAGERLKDAGNEVER